MYSRKSTKPLLSVWKPKNVKRNEKTPQNDKPGLVLHDFVRNFLLGDLKLCAYLYGLSRLLINVVCAVLYEKECKMSKKEARHILSFRVQPKILKKTFKKLRSSWWENMFAFSCDLPIYSLAYSPQLYVKIVFQIKTKSVNLKKMKKKYCFKLLWMILILRGEVLF